MITSILIFLALSVFHALLLAYFLGINSFLIAFILGVVITAFEVIIFYLKSHID